MNDCYAGDIGDFCKYGLLRAIFKTTNDKKLGINWYQTDLGKKGKHYAYLEFNNKLGRTIKMFDETLYNSLSPFNDPSYRKIENVEGINILPKNTIPFNDFVPEKPERKSWHKRALQHLNKADIVFLDPDNGIEIGSNPFSIEHVRLEELIDYYVRGKSVIFYSHRPRFENTIKFNNRFSVLNGHFEHSNIRRIRTPRGGQRDYCFILRPEHKTINTRLDAFLNKWKPHFIEVTEND